jgi:hypothetical protein
MIPAAQRTRGDGRARLLPARPSVDCRFSEAGDDRRSYRGRGGAARDVLRSCSTAYGLRASARDDGNPGCGTRDTAISLLLGTCADGFEEAVPALEASLTALTRAQSTPGYVPLNVDPLGSELR